MNQQITKTYFANIQTVKAELPWLRNTPVLDPVVINQVVSYPWFHRNPVDPFNKRMIASGKPETHVLTGNPQNTQIMPLFDPYRVQTTFGPYPHPAFNAY